MSALHRPVGDEIAEVYGPYKSKKDLKKLKLGDKFDMLCTDGLNYHVEIKELNDDRSARLHFCFWGKKYDYVGPVDTLYLADVGKYSEGISAQNTYPALAKNGEEEEKPVNKKASTSNSSSNGNKGEGKISSYSETQRYPEDFLSKPRFKSSQTRKRPNDDDQDEEIVASTKRLRSDTGYQVDGSSGSGDDETPETVNAESSAPISVEDNHQLATRTKVDDLTQDHRPSRVPHHRLMATDAVASSSSSSSSSDAAYKSVMEALLSTAEETPERHHTIVQGLRGVLAPETSIKETKKALEIITRYSRLFENASQVADCGSVNVTTTKKKTVYTSSMLSELLLARRQIDEVVMEILNTLE